MHISLQRNQKTDYINNNFLLLTILNYLRTMRTIKIKLPFAQNTGIAERRFNLFQWAMTLVKNATLNILDEQHYEGGSYIVVENTYNPGK